MKIALNCPTCQSAAFSEWGQEAPGMRLYPVWLPLQFFERMQTPGKRPSIELACSKCEAWVPWPSV
jgi:hypothetical protein